MKKHFLFFLAIVLVTLGLASCNNDYTPNLLTIKVIEVNALKAVKDVKEMKAIQEANVDSATAKIKIEPIDTSLYYYYDIYKAADLRNMTVEFIADSLVKKYGESSYLASIYNMQKNGVRIKKDTIEFVDTLISNTRYAVVAFFFDKDMTVFGNGEVKYFPTGQIDNDTLKFENAVFDDVNMSSEDIKSYTLDGDTIIIKNTQYTLSMCVLARTMKEDVTSINTYLAKLIDVTHNKSIAFREINLKPTYTKDITSHHIDTLDLNGFVITENGSKYELIIKALQKDNEAPVMSIAELVSVTGNQAVIKVAATDNIGVTAYHVDDTKNGVDTVLVPNDNTITVPDLKSGTKYHFTITALDAAGNESDKDNRKIVNVTTLDEEAPVINAVELVSITNTTAVIKVDASDNVGVSKYHVVDSDNNINVELEPNAESQIIVTDLTPGTTYKFTITAEDAAGLKSDPALLEEFTTLDEEPEE